MKTIIISLSFVLLVSSISLSQTSSLNLNMLNDNINHSSIIKSADSPLKLTLSNEKHTDINLGLGYGVAGLYGSSDMPPITAGVQFLVDESISIGGIVGYTTSSYSLIYPLTATTYTWKYTYIMFGARGEYHFLKDSKNLDGYVGLTLGYNAVSFSSNLGGVSVNYTPGGGYILYGAHVGIKYLFSPSIGVFSELGYGIGYFTAGATFRL